MESLVVVYAAANDGPHCVLRELQPGDKDLGCAEGQVLASFLMWKKE